MLLGAEYKVHLEQYKLPWSVKKPRSIDLGSQKIRS